MVHSPTNGCDRGQFGFSHSDSFCGDNKTRKECMKPIGRKHPMSNRYSIKKALEHFLRSLPPIEPLVLIVLAICAASLWGFIKTADAVFENETQGFDRWMLIAFRDP